jgi:hypothetical protein
VSRHGEVTNIFHARRNKTQRSTQLAPKLSKFILSHRCLTVKYEAHPFDDLGCVAVPLVAQMAQSEHRQLTPITQTPWLGCCWYGFLSLFAAERRFSLAMLLTAPCVRLLSVATLAHDVASESALRWLCGSKLE